ncbi:MAG: hypothetical protein ABIO68_05150 [Sphingomicrobium sp.]
MFLTISATVVSLTMLQATINAPRDAFRECTRSATSSARSESVKPDDFEAYMRDHCSGQFGALKAAVQAFNMKNGMPRKAASEDAQLTVDDYAAGPIEQYRARTPAALSAVVSSEPPKP